MIFSIIKITRKPTHRRLFLKLHHSGVRSNTLSWIADFLSGRSQEVVLEVYQVSEDTTSDTYNLQPEY
jgi:hypothetical protein